MDFNMSEDDRAASEAAARQTKEYHDKLSLAYGEVFKTNAGKFVLNDLKERCNVDNSCVRGDATHPDPYAVMFQEGKRAVYNHIMTYVRRDYERRKRQ